MSPALWGLLTALGWGSADFIAPFTSRALGHRVALFGMLAAGTALLTAAVWLLEMPLARDPSGVWLIALTGIGVMVATMLLYWGLARGPVTVVAPIVGSYPAFNVALALMLGVRPTQVQWAAMGVVMAGVVIVALSSGRFEARWGYTRAQLTRTVWIALSASLGFAVTVAAAQYATPIYGELQTAWMARWVSLTTCGLVLLALREPPRLPVRWWPWLLAQGMLDTGAYLALAAGSRGEAKEITAVVASTFSAITVLLARIILREPMTWQQWGGIALIIGGVAVLSGR
jgi:drug/metabolite transporter (DMT)-like permease